MPPGPGYLKKMASLTPPGSGNEPILDRTTSLSRLPIAGQAQKTTLPVNFTMVSPTAIKYHAIGLSRCSGFCNHSTRRIPPTRNLLRDAGNISNASEVITVHSSGKITGYGHFSFPYGLTNPRKAVTYTLARRDRNDYLISILNNFHSKRTSEFDTHLKHEV